ncbi:MAG: signal recognition particle subunit SRP19/SEC65 family protein [Candidatus Bathyarchaeia archaeon]|nr:signal recognition particle protein Srp19 [Candidatus Bathyarchaeota archaeon]
MRRRDSIVLWPVYFDSSRTRREGRRLPKKFCISSPSIDLLEKAVKSLGLIYEVYREAAYPRLPWIKMGCIIVRRGGERKLQVLKKIASEIMKISGYPTRNV